MEKYTRDIILLLRDEEIGEQAIEMEVKNLHEVIASVETIDVFCKSHELVARNRITRKKFKIINAIGNNPLRPFYFLISRN